METRIQECIAKREQYSELFKNTFDVPLSRFYDNLLGLDIVSFDTWLRVPNGISISDYITAEYGESVNAMIKDLL